MALWYTIQLSICRVALVSLFDISHYKLLFFNHTFSSFVQNIHSHNHIGKLLSSPVARPSINIYVE